ncbi:hypothetical protein GGR88_001190 [Sphingomonas jejuensis]|uniref:Glycosyltransferase 2-like domain-containing protein n=1 Tax=Sphingomonas jejuensis TaxID=904715 RepID=A0ABX0XK38_9SPHN|nr:glycosyltransferase [Sphingomonas jejuensis]NJC33716.1 hypothetical protein [Sphingomonas jejuensis]
MRSLPPVGIVIIGRNEGERLVRCLASAGGAHAIVYVDSGSTDGSVAAAREAGAEVVELDVSVPFTAARARNAGLARLLEIAPDARFVQMVDGDCELARDWIGVGSAALEDDGTLAAVFGRRRERHPDASLYNAMCDEEWDVPVGPVRACGGDALFRIAALQEAGGYDPTLIAGEEPDLCWRMGARGWAIRRLPAEMTLHDAAMTRFSQAHRRSKRAGHAFAELVWRHGSVADPSWRRAVKSTLLWGIGLPGIAVAGALGAFAWLPALILPIGVAGLFGVQWLRIASAKRRAGFGARYAQGAAGVLLATKISQAAGLLRFHLNRLRGRRGGLIEYKASG